MNDEQKLAKGFALRLKELLVERGWNERELARAAGPTVSFSTVNDWTTARRLTLPRTRQLMAVADACNCTLDWLISGREPKYQQRQSPASAAIFRAQLDVVAECEGFVGDQRAKVEKALAATLGDATRAAQSAQATHQATRPAAQGKPQRRKQG